ncbi:MAG TPA: hypothetical protein VNO33_23290 [Kofleriaceae bacterium]|nr:hypothetical protein [Kofleriaceae bacterium]
MPKHPILTVLLLSAAPALASPGGSARRPPDDAQAPRELIALRGQLFNAGEQRARQQMQRFRPLCDRDGYPLVGNVLNKGELYQPSQFCAEVRKVRS